jgi:hypothetical protein
MLLVFVGSLVLAAGAAYWLVTHRRAARSRAPQKAKATGGFGSVEIRIRSGACDAARALEGQRFLSQQAPALPLPACNVAQCSCRFAKLEDRRTDGRRLEHEGLSASLFLDKNRRAKRDRRAAKKKKAP